MDEGEARSQAVGRRWPSRPSGIVALTLPLILAALVAASLALPPTRPVAVWLLAENHPVEMLTFVSLLAGGVLGLGLAWRSWALGHGAATAGFHLLMAVGLLLTAMEEISWGQQFLGFATPEALLAVNAQGETTLHNIQGMQGRTEYLRLAFGLGGLIGVGLGQLGHLRRVAPAASLTPWFLVIAALAAIDLYNDFFPFGTTPDFIVERLAEVVELFIGIAGFLYVRGQRAALAGATRGAWARA